MVRKKKLKRKFHSFGYLEQKPETKAKVWHVDIKRDCWLVIWFSWVLFYSNVVYVKKILKIIC